MRSALDARVFEVFYQAKVVADENKVVGMEALLRWRGEDGELISRQILSPWLKKPA